MRLRDPRWTLVALLSCLTAVSLGLTGEITRMALLLPLAALAGEWRDRRGARAGFLLHAAFQLLALLALGYFLWRLVRFDLLGGVVALTLPAQAYYLVLPRTHRLLSRLQVLSLFQLISLAATTTKIYFVLSLAVFVLLAPAVFTLSALEAGQAERRALPLPRGLLRSGAVAAVAGLLLGSVLFLLLPRYEAGLGRMLGARDERLSGFSGNVELGDIGRILTSDAIVMRVQVDGPMDGALRWRGLALDEFTGKGWRVGRVRKRTVRSRRGELRLQDGAAGAPVVRQEFVLEPLRSRAIFALPNPLRIRSRDFGELEVDAFGGLERWFTARSRVEYTVWSAPSALPRGPEDPALLQRCLRLPELDPRVAELGAQVTAGLEDPAEKGQALVQYLRASHDYTLDVRDAGLEDPVTSFLLDRRAGHCEYFASGMTLLARTQGIPSRVVTGFQAGTWSRLTRSFVVRQRDAHSWVELYLPGRGWTAYDPTPVVERGTESGGLGSFQELWRALQVFWDDNVVGFNFNHQAAALTTLGEWRDAARQALRGPLAGGLLPLLLLLLLAGAGLLARRGRAAGPGRARRAFYQRTLSLLRRRGLALAQGQTPAELAAEAARRGGPAGEAAVELTELYYAARFGGREPDAERVRQLLELLSEMPDLRESA